jgi:hypothetical protein
MAPFIEKAWHHGINMNDFSNNGVFYWQWCQPQEMLLHVFVFSTCSSIVPINFSSQATRIFKVRGVQRSK